MYLLQRDKRINLLIGVMAVLYTALLIFAFASASPLLCNVLGYAAECACFLAAVVAYKHTFRRSDARILMLALMITLVADALFMFANSFALGIAVLTFAHLCYIRRYRIKLFKPFLTILLSFLLFCFIAYIARLNFPLIPILGVFYTILLFTVTVTGFMSRLPGANKKLVIAGMILFLLCDFNVAATFLAPDGRIMGLATAALISLFYIPSQMCLALSSVDKMQKSF
jgi:YhhN-like protein.